MKTLTGLIALSLCAAAPAFAQQAALAGNWTAKWETNGRPYEARLKLTEQGGTWNSSAKSRRDACVGIEAPVETNYVSDDEITMNLAFSKTMQGCTDVLLRLKKTSDNTLTGARDVGSIKAEIVLTRD